MVPMWRWNTVSLARIRAKVRVPKSKARPPPPLCLDWYVNTTGTGGLSCTTRPQTLTDGTAGPAQGGMGGRRGTRCTPKTCEQ